MSAASPSAPLDPLIGRSEELVALDAALGEARLVTVTGLGGTGKTRLVREFARRMASAGALTNFVDLAPLVRPADLPGAIAAVLGVREAPGSDLATAIGRVLARSPSLLVLDNLEHLLVPRETLAARDAMTALVAALLERSEPLRILATSRVRLGLPGERELALGPLPVPAGAEDVEEAPAGRLFIRRARERGGLQTLGPPDAAAVAAICRRLDGLPLAIELAAAWTRILGAEAILRRLESGRLELAGGEDARRRSLEAIVASTLALVDERAAESFEALAVFAGGFDEPAAAAVTGHAGILSILRRLEEVALVRVLHRASEDPRFGLLQPIRAVAAARLAVRADGDDARRRHAVYFAAWVEPMLEALRSSAAPAGRRAVEMETDNLRAAYSYAVDLGAADLSLRLATALAVLARRSAGGLREHAERLRDALADPSVPPRSRSEGLVALAWLELELSPGDPVADAATAEAVTLAHGVGDRLLLVRALIARATVAAPPDAIELFIEAAELATASGFLWEASSAYNNAADALGCRGRLEEAHRFSLEAIAISTRAGDSFGAALAQMNAGEIELNQGHVEAAREHLTEAVEAFRVASSGIHFARSLSILAAVETAAGRPVEAVRLLEAASAIVDDSGSYAAAVNLLGDAVTVLSGPQRVTAARALGAVRRGEERIGPLLGQPLLDDAASLLQRTLGSVRYGEAWREGHLEGPQAVFAEVRQLLAAAYPRPADRSPRQRPLRGRFGEFTPREEEVLALLAAGRTDGEIAARLFISPKTASVHVTNIKGKLGVETRVEAALEARRLLDAAGGPASG